jgi:Flp pilus assembly protein TadG
MRSSFVPYPLKKCGDARIEVSFRERRRAPRHGARANSGQRGYILVALSLAVVFLLGIGGLAIDIGRMYITKSEAQSFVDTAAFAATLQLDGTAISVTRAQTAVTNDPKKWQFQNSSFTNVTTTFATASSGPWTATPPNPPTGYYFTQVQTTVNLPMYLMGALAGPTAQVAASAIAGRQGDTGEQGEFPFSPYTRTADPDNAADPFGYKVGNQYTLRWGSPGDKTNCGTDATQPSLAVKGQERGYCCVKQSAATLRQAIVGGDTDPMTVGNPVEMDNGAQNIQPSAMAQRVNYDSDTTSATYAQYLASGTGNGMRVVLVPVNNGPPNYIVVGFAGFFLLKSSYYSGLNGNASACGEYIGTYTHGAGNHAPGGTGAFHIKLFQ